MKPMTRHWTIALCALLTLCVGVADAQISKKGGPIAISADTQTADNNLHMATYKGKVEALQDGNRMRTDLLNIYFKQSAAGAPKTASADPAESSFGKIDHLEAIGNVYFVTPTQVIRGDHAVWTQATDTIVMTGDVVVTQGENVMRGSRLTYDHATGKSIMDADPHTGRVISVFYPDKKQNPGH
jgi:lipopolysaccharide export system protein LptA